MVFRDEETARKWSLVSRIGLFAWGVGIVTLVIPFKLGLLAVPWLFVHLALFLGVDTKL